MHCLLLKVYYGPEPDFWMIMTVHIPEKGVRFVSNLTLRSMLMMSYDLFTIFYGTFTNLMETVNTIDGLRVRLSKYSSWYFLSVEVYVQICDHRSPDCS